MTLGEWVTTWLELYVDPARLAESTKACYHRSARSLSASLLATMPLEQLTALDLRRWLLQVAKEHPRAAQLDRVMLSRCLRLAQKAGMAPPGLFDPELVPPIDHKAAKAPVLNSEQLRAYMDAAARTEAAPVLLLCCCGLRRGEAMGARWEHLDMKSSTLKVIGQRIGDRLAPLKTRAAVRQLELPPVVMAAIMQQRRQLAGWVCDLSQQRVYAAHRAALAAARLPQVTLHGLRHSFATLAVMEGVPIKLVQGALGHAHFAITADLYADHLPDVSAVSSQLFAHDWKSCVG